jgi:hypothetical protein
MNCLLSFSKLMKWKHFLKTAYDPKNKSEMVLLKGNLADFPFNASTKSNGRIL